MNFVRLFVNSKGYSSVSEYYSGHVLIWVASLKKRKDVLELMRGERLYDCASEIYVTVLGHLHLIWVCYMSQYVHAQFQPTGTTFGVSICKTLL